jgi:hypothetical protein
MIFQGRDFMTQRFTDFICYADTVVDKGNGAIFMGPEGVRQALDFGLLGRGYERYERVIVDGSAQADLTCGHILNAMGPKCPKSVIAELTDPKRSDQHSEQRRLAYAKLGKKPLAKFHDECIVAMVDLGQNAAEPLQRFFLEHIKDNILVVCRDIYLAQIILTTFFSVISQSQQKELLHRGPPGPCSGYRLTWDNTSLKEMSNIP